MRKKGIYCSGMALIMLTTILAYLLIGLFFVIEGRTRKGQQAQSLDRGQFDQKSTAYIGIAYLVAGLGLLLAPVLNYFGIGPIAFPAYIGWVGLFVAVMGIAMRFWGNYVLGEFYTRTLRVTERQVVVQQGPYQVIRHPGYLGSILMWSGAALATVNWISTLLAVAVMFTVYSYRIISEENMMMKTYGEQYRQYKSRTWKLIPFVY
jgi:protein-S-isoprenylcysteine O-methyltransferase Ste14